VRRTKARHLHARIWVSRFTTRCCVTTTSSKTNCLRSGIKTLDVGCSLGALPAYLAKRGARAFGIEVSRYAREGQRLFGLKTIAEQPIETYDQQSDFDIVTLSDVLEHLADPMLVLQRVRELMSDDGVLLIGVPDLFHLHNAVMTFFSNTHASTFSPASITNLLGRCGFSVTRLKLRRSVQKHARAGTQRTGG